MKRAVSLADIATHGLCAGCGLCAGIAPAGTVTMEMSAAGFLRPRAIPSLPAEIEGELVALCPGNQLWAPANDAPAHDPIWGPHYGPLKGHATDAEIRFKASSGGVISAIAAYLLENGVVDMVVHVGMDAAAPLQSRLLVSRDRAGVIAGASARYGPIAPLESIGEILATGRPFAFIGKPCDVAGMRNLAKVDPRVGELMRYALAFFCAGVSSLRISESIVAKYGLAPGDVGLMRYRGHGCPGATRIEAKDGRVFEQTYDDTWSEELNQEIQFRCKICPDGIGEQADIACGDAWVGNGGYAYAEHDGWNSLMARTARGAELLARMEAAAAVHLEPITLADLNGMQPHQVERKQAVLARLAGMATAGAPLPRFSGQNLLRAAWLGRGRLLANFRGTRQRVRRGANRETPDAAVSAAPRRGRRDWSLPAVPFLALPAMLLMLLLVGLPLLTLIAYSFWTQDYVSIDRSFTLANYLTIGARPLYATLLLRSIGIALATMAATVILAYPMAYFIAFHGGRHRTSLLVMVAVPFWTSYLLRIFAWKVMLGYNGVINGGLIALGVTEVPLEILLYNPFAVVLTLTHAWLPFVMLPIYVSLSKIDPSLLEAAADLGDGAWRRLRRVVLPMSVPGMISGALLVFIPTVGDYVTPALVGGTAGTMIGNVIQGQFGRANNWPLGAALSIVMMLTATLLAIAIQLAFTRLRRGRGMS